MNLQDLSPTPNPLVFGASIYRFLFKALSYFYVFLFLCCKELVAKIKILLITTLEKELPWER